MSSGSRVAIITGASSGIGKATALLFAKNGYQLSLSGRNEKALAEVAKECIGLGLPEDAVTLTVGDLREDSVAKDLIDHTVKTYEGIDILVNSAGILVTGNVEDTKVTDFDRQFDVNVRSVVQLTKYAIPHLVKSKGTIVNVSSVAGPCAFPGVAYYCMSKAALDQFTKCLALELAPKGVRVNSVNPGVIVTDIHRRSGMPDEDYAEFLKKGENTHAMGRVGLADEVAEGILFLASSKSSFTTGHLLSIDGGRHLMTPR
ncbi:oxidoreductaseshort chain dehydrogenase/reductase family protein [Aphelenchoides avenae]|nr:oxidoreductaseshort chain dehydrogenase/reductase family protein [Aphelenchus avenae]